MGDYDSVFLQGNKEDFFPLLINENRFGVLKWYKKKKMGFLFVCCIVKCEK